MMALVLCSPFGVAAVVAPRQSTFAQGAERPVLYVGWPFGRGLQRNRPAGGRAEQPTRLGDG